MAEDHVGRIVEQWTRERPDLDPSPIRIIGRISRLSRSLDRQLQDRLEQRGLVRRRKLEGDKRVVQVQLTDEGKAAIDDAVPAHLHNERAILEPLSERETRQLERLLQKRALAGKCQELLGPLRPAARPKPRPAAAGHD